MWLDIVKETGIDSLNMLPFLFLSYLIIEYLEHKSSSKIEHGLKSFGALAGALLGCFPQCGFSVAAAKLYSEKIITAGTLVAVFISTSDEALPILLANPGKGNIIIAIIFIKLIIAITSGIILDFVLKNNTTVSYQHTEIKHKCNDGCSGGLFMSAIKHTLNIFAFIVLFTFLMNTAITIIGSERLSVLLLNNNILQPAISALVGFIPNCAASVLLTELYLSGNISFGSIIAGLSTGAGAGLIVLFKSNKNLKENFKIMAYIFMIGTVVGMIIQTVML